MFQLFVILAVVAAVLLTGIVLIQESKGGGLASNFSGMNALAGVRKTTDVVEKLTWALAAALVVCSIVTAKCTILRTSGSQRNRHQYEDDYARRPHRSRPAGSRCSEVNSFRFI